MKIGIITHHWVPNFGANLQALATVSILNKLGHEPVIINYRPKLLVEKYKQSISSSQYNIHEEYLNEFLPQTEVCSNAKEVKEINEKHNFDYLISGSDAVFRLDYELNREDTTFPNPFWLTFADNHQKRMFFSVSSMGSDYSVLSKKIKREITQILKSSKVFVRDLWTSSELKKLDSTLKINQSVDPVFLLHKYFAIPNKFKTKISDEKYILINLYGNLLSDKWIKSFVETANSNGYKVYLFPNPENNEAGKEFVNDVIDIPIHPLKWYSILKNSSGYIGVRFHPIVTAISNHVPFLAIDTYQRSIFNRKSSKTYDICKKVDATKYCIGPIRRRLLTPKRALKIMLENKVNFQKIDSEIEKIENIFKPISRN